MVKIPGQSTRGSRTGRPIMVLLDVLGQRWTLRILWELHQSRASFRTLQERCDGVSPTLLNKRLKNLRSLNLVDLDKDGYGLSAMGQSLTERLAPVGAWAKDWADQL